MCTLPGRMTRPLSDGFPRVTATVSARPLARLTGASLKMLPISPFLRCVAAGFASASQRQAELEKTLRNVLASRALDIYVDASILRAG